MTTKSWQNIAVFQVRETAEIVVRKIIEYRDRKDYLLHEFVLMPNHLHLLLTPSETVSLEKAIQLIKGGSSHEIHLVQGNKMPIWQSGFHESRVKDWANCKAKMDYIHFNPVAAKLVQRPQDWRFCSASGRFALDPIPQGLKPIVPTVKVGPKGPTPKSLPTIEERR
ncbi:MAG TPA: transposase [Candidatus Acidoferrum sp.]|nr:transposase [Candidatus Acidoferrum sp.]